MVAFSGNLKCKRGSCRYLCGRRNCPYKGPQAAMYLLCFRNYQRPFWLEQGKRGWQRQEMKSERWRGKITEEHVEFYSECNAKSKKSFQWEGGMTLFVQFQLQKKNGLRMRVGNGELDWQGNQFTAENQISNVDPNKVMAVGQTAHQRQKKDKFGGCQGLLSFGSKLF